MMRSANPVLSDNAFSRIGYRSSGIETMTSQGTVIKTAILLLCVLLTAGWTWMSFVKGGYNPAVVAPWMTGGALGGFVIALVTAFKKEWSPITAPVYAVLEGLFIGGLSAVMEASYPGIAIQAALLTLATLAAMLGAYQMGFVKVTESFRLGVTAATGGIAIVYLATLVLGFFGIQIPGIFGNGIVGIGFSLLVCGVAALNLVMDFDFVQQGARMGAPKYMEWYGAFALMVTLVWLYIEVLRLLSKLRER